MVTSAGYSGTPLARKLGIKEGFTILLYQPPDYFWTLFDQLPQNLKQVESSGPKTIDYLHFFVTQPKDLKYALAKILPLMKVDGALWISWPKKTAKIPSKVDKWMVLQLGREAGLVDIKVAAIDETWSGQKFVYRVKDR